MDIMEAERVKFIYGYHEDGLDIPGCIANGISKEIAEQIYDQMIDFAKYAFNKSHAAAYAAISMQTAYLKAHHPLEFSAGLLTSVMDDLKKLPVYISEYRLKGFEILPPDVNSSGGVFSPVEGCLCYGLYSIKNAGKEALDGIIRERDTNGQFKGYSDFVKRCWRAGKKTIEALIKAGALDFSGLTRRTMLQNLEKLIDGHRKEQKKVFAGQMNLLDYLEEGTMEYEALTADNIADLPEYESKEKLAMEKEATGFYISGHPLDPYLEVLKSRYHLYSNQWFLPSEDTGEYQLRSGENIVIAGVVTENRIVYTKKDSRPMSLVTIEDPVCAVKAVIFPDTYDRFGHIPQEDNLVAIKGTVKMDDRGISVIADMVFKVDEMPQDLYVRFKDRNDFERNWRTLKQLSDKYSGGIGSIIYCFEGEKQGKLFYGAKQSIQISTQCIMEAKQQFGEWNVMSKDFHLF